MHAIMRFVLRLFNVLRISQSLIVMSFRIFSWFSQTLCAHRWSNPLRCAFNPSRPSILAVEVVALEAHALRHILRKDMQTKYILDGWYDREWYDGTRLPCFSFPTLAVSWKRFISCQQTVLTGLDIPPLGSFHFASKQGQRNSSRSCGVTWCHLELVVQTKSESLEILRLAKYAMHGMQYSYMQYMISDTNIQICWKC